MTPEEIFVRGVWKFVRDEGDPSWVRQLAELPRTTEPSGDLGSLVRRMVDAGIQEQEIARFAKLMGYETAFGVLYHLGDPNASYERFPMTREKLAWQLFLVDDETDEPQKPMTCLHEWLLSMDPSGREMRPAGNA